MPSDARGSNQSGREEAMRLSPLWLSFREDQHAHRYYNYAHMPTRGTTWTLCHRLASLSLIPSLIPSDSIHPQFA